jgi:hypothetical protein
MPDNLGGDRTTDQYRHQGWNAHVPDQRSGPRCARSRVRLGDGRGSIAARQMTQFVDHIVITHQGAQYAAQVTVSRS